MSGGPVILIGGPTASGKSALALAIAERFDGTVINADSMQVYRDLEIVTARPRATALAKAPHRLYGVLGATEPCSAGRWREMALAEIGAAADAGRLPVLVGGTGLYLRALTTGLHRLPAVPHAVRDELNERLAAEGPEALHRELAARDPETASRLAPGDRQRIVRALEVLAHTGRGLSAWQSGETDGAPEGLRFLTLLAMPPRDALYAACDGRFLEMLEDGAEAEVARFLGTAPETGCPLAKAVGVQAIAAYLAGEIPRDRMIERGQRDTRRYAKRQVTWFRHQIVADMCLETKFSEINLDRIFPFISNFLLTDR